MPENDPTPDPTPEGGTPPADPTPEPAKGEDLADEVEKWKALSRKNEEKAKANAAKAKDYDALVASQQTEQEKAVAAAKAEGMAEGTKAAGAKLVAAEFRAAAAGRIEPDKLSTVIDGLNLPAYLTEDGDVDAAKVAAYVDAIVPGKPTSPPGIPGQGDLGEPPAKDPIIAAIDKALPDRPAAKPEE